MKGGYIGKILVLDLKNKTTSILDTEKYIEFGGGNGLGTAVWWELCADLLPFDAYDERNAVVMMTSPLTGTLSPGSGRMEMLGLGPQAYPIHWFTRSGCGGRLANQLKAAGWDGLVITGKSEKPVWINIINDAIKFEDAAMLWGKDTWDTQDAIWKTVQGTTPQDGWNTVGESGSDFTTQRPAVACIGPLGEAKAGELGCVCHDSGHAFGQGGFGAVWGAKNLKAISILGSGSVPIADPKGLLDTWNWAKQFWPEQSEVANIESMGEIGYVANFGPIIDEEGLKNSTPVGCISCPKACHGRRGHTKDGITNEFHCSFSELTDRGAQEAVQRWGANAYCFPHMMPYLQKLYGMGVLGKGKAIDSDLPCDNFGKGVSKATIERFFQSIVDGTDIGAALRDGTIRAVYAWHREEDLKTGVADYPYWGYQEHCYDGRMELEWGYEAILGNRDPNGHMIAWRIYVPICLLGGYYKRDKILPASEAVKIYAEKMKPFTGDERMIDYSTPNMYTEHIAKLVAWHEYYMNFYQYCMQFCDFMFPDTVNPYGPNYRGMTPDGEPKFINAVTGGNMTFEDGIEIGRKIWNVQNAIWTLQGRHRDMVKFADYYYDVKAKADYVGEYLLPTLENGSWDYRDVSGRSLSREGVEAFKTTFYKLQGWDTASGWPTRETLVELGLTNVADLLDRKGKLGE